jgi:hypothetical protein
MHKSTDVIYARSLDDYFLCTITAGVEHQIGKHKMYRGSIDCVISKLVKKFNRHI